MVSLFKSVIYGVINTYDTTTNGYSVIQYISESYTLQIIPQIDGQDISAGELVAKAQYIFSVQ